MINNFDLVNQFRETPFEKLMENRITDILLICSQYDKFMLDEDGRIDDQLFQEYGSLNLRYPPRFFHVTNEKKAFEELNSKNYDLVITMLNYKGTRLFNLADKIKESFPDIPVVILSPFSKKIFLQIESIETIKADYVFSWLGNARLLLAIIKLIEDRMNVEHDVETGNVQVIILVEDSVRYYSSYLPNIYRLLFKQARRIMEEGLNEYEQNMRMRGRPKILLATSFDEAVELYEKYKNNVLGIISDIGYKISRRKGEAEDPTAGIKLCKIIRDDNSDIPILLQSAQLGLKSEAEKYNASFIYKHSDTLLKELRDYIRESYGFGDFIFKGSDGIPFEKAGNLKELQEKLAVVPGEVVLHHIKQNHFSKWLRARALFCLADIYKPIQITDFDNSLPATKKHLIEIIRLYREYTGKGSIASFDNTRFDEFTHFSRIGDGSLGGKGRGLAFIDTIIKKQGLTFKFKQINITIPRTIVLSTSVFEDFMELNALYDKAFSDSDDSSILHSFLHADLPVYAKENIKALLEIITVPIAVRSSSLLEDSLYQPFAGVYATYMLPNKNRDLTIRCLQLEQAVKSVYASTYFKKSKLYISATKNVIDEEKMAVIIQELAGREYGNCFYPDFSGVARSYNYYPLSNEKTEEGIAEIALGLGKTVVDGGSGLRFSPSHPKKIVQFSSVESIMSSTQKVFYALDLDPYSFTPTISQEQNMPLLDVSEAENIPGFKYMASTYDMQNHMIKDTITINGQRVITFAGILKYDMFPLAAILKKLLKLGHSSMKCPIEIEFAVNLSDSPEGNHVFSFLQIRPIVEGEEEIDLRINNYDNDQLIVHSMKALGNGKHDTIFDMIYIKPESFDPAHTASIAEQLDRINSEFVKKEVNYILMVPGRLGSSDPWLGIPVNWAQISNAILIIETGLKNFQVEPSQGTHFFQNITSLGIAYFTINPVYKDGYADIEYLESQPAVFEDKFIKHIVFKEQVTIIVDGKKREGIILKPGSSAQAR
ncbi:MAG: PEP/pyruvate-binding domain-containing protein [Spirochaetia bacterium]|nr:PEP/pyruvate-binding domain-containing protein [Spirochaetia bacterium]